MSCLHCVSRSGLAHRRSSRPQSGSVVVADIGIAEQLRECETRCRRTVRSYRIEPLTQCCGIQGSLIVVRTPQAQPGSLAAPAGPQEWWVGRRGSAGADRPAGRSRHRRSNVGRTANVCHRLGRAMTDVARRSAGGATEQREVWCETKHPLGCAQDRDVVHWRRHRSRRGGGGDNQVGRERSSAIVSFIP
jgi:hypothetical protein